MNHADLKNYAPQARRDFIQAVTDRAAFYGVTAEKIEPVTEKGDVAIIAGHAFPASLVAKRKKLIERIGRDGFDQTMEALAYTWFNRFVAIRFMELHAYLEHGYRVLSHPDPAKTIPEILELAEHVDLPGLNREKVVDLKLDGNKESELYQMLLLAQCHALHSAMPFLFEGIDDETELVLPENLLHSDSIIRKLVAASDSEDWQEVEVLGWLYQFYISERKEEVMAHESAVASDDIPAVTQLFTPHWIVRYLVENSLGRLWLLNRPGSKLREQMPYYIDSEAETDFLRIAKPEEIRFLDPACGSGHMLTYAFELLFRIYEEAGYVPSEIPALILRHNLYGLEICPRAAQLANLSLAFKAREKSYRFLDPGHIVAPHILALQNTRFEESELHDYFARIDLGALLNQPMLQLLYQFEEATTFGSLIRPCIDDGDLAYARQAIEVKDPGSEMFLRETHGKVSRVLAEAEMLTRRYQVVATNPPYMGSGAMNAALKRFAVLNYPESKHDLYAMFIERCIGATIEGGFVAMIAMQSWMFLSRFEVMRIELLSKNTIFSMAHLGAHAFDSIGGEVVSTASFVLKTRAEPNLSGKYFRLVDFQDSASKERALLAHTSAFTVSSRELQKLPGTPIAYWLSPAARDVFSASMPLEAVAPARAGLQTGENEKFVRLWYEVEITKCGLNNLTKIKAQESQRRWFPYNSGGNFRKWYGNNEKVVDWWNDGQNIKQDKLDKLALGLCLPSNSKPKNEQYYFRKSITWTKIGSGSFGVRLCEDGFLFDIAGSSAFPSETYYKIVAGFLLSSLAVYYVRALNPTLNIQTGDIAQLPWLDRNILESLEAIASIVDQCVLIAKSDWDNFETSWNFRDHPLLRSGLKGKTLEASWQNWQTQSIATIRRQQELEKENNRLFIEAYGLQSELQPEVLEEQITLARADRRQDAVGLLSYATGCIMGRYSIDEPGLILANAGASLDEYLARVGKPSEKLLFSPDEDGIIPVVDGEWFKDDIATRAVDFLFVAFGEATLAANIRFIEESLGKDLRKYFLIDFYKDHLQTYKKRPIYWLFSSGKERAFQALVYLHRYHEGTLSRMRTEYVIPLQGKIASRIDQSADDIQKATSTFHRKKMEKERDKLLRQRTELQAFDERLRHYADQRIQLDLDVGVKVNYGKFGDLLAEVKAVTGESDE